jgi:hypothetical protein
MIMKRILYFIAISCLTLLTALNCGGGDEPTPDSPVVVAPDKVTLLTPADNSTCLKGSSESGTTASLSFSWEKAAHADSYQLDVKNLLTQQVSSFTTTNLTYNATLTINTPYSWSVTSVNSKGKTSGPSWKFYLAGAAASSYAPFPAELTAPASGTEINSDGAASVQVSFAWQGSDVDNDIDSYALYLDNENAATRVIASQTDTTATQTLTSGKTYFWKVVTTDKVGNKSNSIVSHFQIK